MSESSSFVRRRWKLLLNIFTVIVLVALAYAIRHQLAQTLDNLTKVHAWALALIVPVEVLNYHAQTKLYQTLFRTTNTSLRYKFLLKMSVELNFVNHVFPSGGLSGISYFGLRLKNEAGVSAGKASLIQMMKLILLFFSFEVLLVIGVLCLAIGGKANDFVMLVAGSLGTFMVLGTAGFAYVIGSHQRINTFLTIVTKVLNKLIHKVRPHHPETINIEKVRYLFEEMHENYKLFKSRVRELQAPFWYAVLANATEVLAIYVVYIAFGHWVNIGAVILAYAVANIAGVLSVTPGGVGVYEALMTAVLVSAGIPAALSLPVTVMYRVVNTLLQVPPGYVLYHRSLMARQSYDKQLPPGGQEPHE